MKKPLRILHLEDDPDFSALVRALLEKEAIHAELCVVSTRADFEKALSGGNFDIILADYLLPEYNGIEALRCARARTCRSPFAATAANGRWRCRSPTSPRPRRRR